MSGITGIFHRDGKPVKRSQIQEMIKSISHRGPDGSDIYKDGEVALAHQMLHTTPESIKEKQPFKDLDEKLVITADARIDNREDLLRILRIKNSNISDSELLLKSYLEWGEECPKKLIGDFSFAIWDQSDHKLFCARDHIGVKPFYYFLSDELFFFASEIKALFTDSQVPRIVNKMQIANYLILYYLDREITSYENILRLPAAHSLVITPEKIRLKQYWALDSSSRICLDSDQNYLNEFRNIFTEAVRCRLRSAYPMGSMLSGGLDSSSITGIAQKILKNEGKKLSTFSAIFDSVPESNERYYIEKILSTDNFDSHFVNADQISPLDPVDEFYYYGDQFLFMPNHFIFWNLLQQANQNGVRVLLDGLEGDATVSYGDGLVTNLFWKWQWKKFIKEINNFSKKEGSSFSRTLFYVLLNSTPKTIKRFSWNFRELRKSYGSKMRIIESNFSKETYMKDKVTELYDKALLDSPHNMHFRDLTSGFYQYIMEFVDWAAARFSIEPRHPFFDIRLIEYCFAIPTEQKRFEGWDRGILRRSMTGVLPIEIQWRKKKADLSYNFNKSLLQHDKEVLDKIILENTEIISEFVDIKKIQKIYSEYKEGDYKDHIHIWDTVTLALWLKKIGY